jgi:hypothetical protein
MEAARSYSDMYMYSKCLYKLSKKRAHSVSLPPRKRFQLEHFFNIPLFLQKQAGQLPMGHLNGIVYMKQKQARSKGEEFERIQLFRMSTWQRTNGVHLAKY